MASPSPQYDVFLSHNSADKSAVEAIDSRLQEAGFRPFFDKRDLMPGKTWQKELTEALDASQCVAIFFGRSGEGPWQSQEMQVALNKAVRTRDDYRVIPVLLPKADPSQVDEFLKLRTWVDFSPGLDDEAAFQRLVAAIKGVAPDSAEGLAELPDEPRPYRGIERFEGEQHQFFFGRDDEIRRLIERMQQDHFVAVVGASGSGKSSLVRAGFYTGAAERAKAGIRNWRRIALMPKSNPLLQLAANLVAHLPESERPALIRTFLDDFRRSPDGLVAGLTTLFPNPDRPVLLLIDQFEELFTQRPQADQNQAEWPERTASFAGNLLATVNHRFDWLRIIITLRADFVDRFVSGDFPEFRKLLERRQFWLGTMAEDDLREVIVRPATGRGAFFEKGLVERILAEMRGGASALPLLEEALDSLWDKRRGPWLTHQAHDRIGGVGGALADKADRIFNRLSKSQQAIARRVFLKLVQLGEGTRDTRRRVSIADLRSVTDDPSEFQTVLDRFSTVGARLITLSSDRETSPGEAKPSDETVEVTHEALIDHWDRLSGWLEAGRDDARLERRLEEAAKRWKAEAEKPDGKPKGILLRPPDLDLARDYVKRIEGSLPELLFDFYQCSERAEKERIARAEEQIQREIQHARHQKAAATRFKLIASIAGVVAVIAIGVGIFALDRNRKLQAELVESQAAAIMASLGSEEWTTESDFGVLKRLADSEEAVRIEFVEQLLASQENAKRLRPRFPYIVHAVVGLDSGAKERLRLVLLEHGKNPSTRTIAINIACTELGSFLDVDDSDFSQMITANYRVVMKEATWPEDLPYLGRSLGSLSEKLKAEQIASLGEQIVVFMEKTNDPRTLAFCAGELVGLGERLPAEQAAAGAQRIVAAVGKTGEQDALDYLSRALAGLGEELSAQQLDALAHRIVTRMENADSCFLLKDLSRLMASLGERLPAEQTAAGAQQIVVVMKNTTEPFELVYLANALAGLSERLPPEKAAALAQRIVAAMEATTEPHALSSYGSVLEGLSKRLPPEQAAAGAQRIIAIMKTTTDPDELSSLGSALGGLGGTLSAEEAATGAQRIMAAMEATTDPSSLKSLTSALSGLSKMLGAEEVASLAGRSVAAIERMTDPSTLSYFRGALVHLRETLSAEDATVLGEQIVVALESTDDDNRLMHLARALGSFREKIPAKLAAASARHVAAAMNKTKDPFVFISFGGALVSLGEELPVDQTTARIQQIVAVIGSADDLNVKESLGNSLSSLCEEFPQEGAETLAQILVAAMKEAPDWDAVKYLGKAVCHLCDRISQEQAVGMVELIAGEMGRPSRAVDSLDFALITLCEKLPEEQVAIAAGWIVSAMGRTSDYHRVRELADVLGSLGERLPAEQATAGAQQIVAAMEQQTNQWALPVLGRAIGNLVERIPAEQAAALAPRVVAAMEETTDPEALSCLGGAIADLGKGMRAEKAAVLAPRIVDVMENSTDTSAFSSLGNALAILGERLPAEQAAVLAHQIVGSMERTTEDYLLVGLGHALGSFAVSMNAEDTIAALKSLVCVGDTRDKVLAGLEKKTGQAFDGRLWKALEWAESQGIDVAKIPRWPIRQE